MGFQKPDLNDAWRDIARCLAEIRSPYNDGWTSSYCKKDLYMLKSWLDEQYKDLPKFSDEEQWEQQRIIDILKRG
jgi:hypothetical protein